MNETLPQAMADQDFAAHHEQLRNQALGRGIGARVGSYPIAPPRNGGLDANRLVQ